MNRPTFRKHTFLFSIQLSWGIIAQPQPPASTLHGMITDPSAASVPAALVELLGSGGDQQTRTDSLGRYSFAALRPGKYVVRVVAEGFRVDERNVEISGSTELNSSLVIRAKTHVVNVEEESKRVSADPETNGTSLAL